MNSCFARTGAFTPVTFVTIIGPANILRHAGFIPPGVRAKSPGRRVRRSIPFFVRAGLEPHRKPGRSSQRRHGCAGTLISAGRVSRNTQSALPMQ
jgi:hypothetical protein